jgi:transmembrane sensor
MKETRININRQREMIDNIEDIANNEDARLILDCKRAIAMDKVSLPNVEEERKRFWKERGLVEKHKIMTLKRWCFVASLAAAVFCGLFVTSYMKSHYSSSNQLKVFEANLEAQNVRLTMDGKTYIINEHKPNNALYNRGIVATKYELNLKNVYHNIPQIKQENYQTISTPCGQIYTVILSDGTEIQLNADSKLIFPDVFVRNQRIVYLKGEAYFKVAHNASRPFIVKTDYFNATDLGTEFNIRAYSKADAHVTLINGKVKVGNSTSEALTLVPGEQVSLAANGDLNKQTVDTYPYLQWQKGFFYFDNASLVEIMQELGRWYNVDVVFENKSILNNRMHFTANRDEDLNQAIRNLNALGIVYASLQENRMVIK